MIIYAFLFIYFILFVTVKSNDNFLNDSNVELYGLDVSLNGEIYASKNGKIDIFGEDVDGIEKAFLSNNPSCHESNSHLIKTFQGKNVVKYKIGNIQTRHTKGDDVYFFCTRPKSLEINSMVRVKNNRNVVWIPVFACFFIFLLILSAIFSGLNLAIMSFSIQDLQLIEEFDSIQIKRKRATDVLTVRKHNNFVLCSIITGNVLCNTIITLIIDYFAEAANMKDSSIVEISSTVFQLIFTEILPALLFTKNALYVASKLHYLVIFFMILTCPLTYPISKILDIFVGGSDNSKKEISEFEMLAGLQAESSTNKDFNEVLNLVRNTLKLGRKTAADVMTPIEKVFMISDSQVVTKRLLKEIVERGHTRLPVIEGKDVNTIRGVLNVKDLVLLIADDQSAAKLTAGTLLGVLGKSQMHRFVLSSIPVPLLMNELEKGNPMAIVIDFNKKREKMIRRRSNSIPYKVVGIVTLEDNIEEVVGEILDEKDIDETTKNYANKAQIFSENSSFPSTPPSTPTKKSVSNPSTPKKAEDENFTVKK